MQTLQQILSSFIHYSALLSAATAIVLFARQRTPLARRAGALILSISICLASYYFVLVSGDGAWSRFWFKLYVIVYYQFVVFFWLQFFLEFTGHSGRLNWRALLSIEVLPTIFSVYALANPGLDPVWHRRGGFIVGSMLTLPRDLGLVGSLIIVYSFVVAAISVFLLIRLLLHVAAFFRLLVAAVTTGVLLGVIGALVEIAGFDPFAPISSFSLAVSLIGVVSFVAVLFLKLGGVLPIARQAVFEQISDAVFILDQRGRIMDLNQAARRLTSRTYENAVGKPLSLVWPEGARILAGPEHTEYTIEMDGLACTMDVTITTLLGINREVLGRAMLMHNVTGHERLQQKLQENSLELEHANVLINSLSRIASRMAGTSSPIEKLKALGDEMNKLGLDCGVVHVDPAGENAVIKYLSLDSALVRSLQKLTGITFDDYAFPRQLWPNDRWFREKKPEWYSDAKGILRRLFVQLPEIVAEKAGGLIGLGEESRFCILPLVVGEQVIGALPVWGSSLDPMDGPALEVFAGQVAGILRNMEDLQYETRRAEELARSNALLMALSRVAARLDASAKPAEVFETLGSQLRASGLHCMVGSLDESQQSMKIEYLSILRAIRARMGPLNILWPDEISVPRRLWPTDKAVTEKAPYWDPDPIGNSHRMFPFVPKNIFLSGMRLAGLDLKDAVCYLPLINKEKSIGILAVWGPTLRREDIPALSVFSNQVATAMVNSKVFEKTQAEMLNRAQAEARIQTALNEAVIATDTAGRVTMLNPTAVALTGWSAQEALGRQLEDIFPVCDDQTRVRFECSAERVLREGCAVNIPDRILLIGRSGREYRIAASGAPMRTDQGELVGVVIVFRDLTERFKLEEQLRHAQKMESIGRLAGGVAHDINNLLAGALAYVELLVEELDEKSKGRRYVDEIFQTMSRIRDVVSRLLAFARKTPGAKRSFDVDEMMQSLQAILKHALGKNIVIESSRHAGPLRVSGDQGQLESALLNLAINAQDAMSGAGTLGLATSIVELDETWPGRYLRPERSGRFVEISVSDTGCGMSPAVIENLFEPFFTTKAKGKGTGLGLSTVYGIVRDHGGAIDVHSMEGRGSVFRIYLPLKGVDSADNGHEPERAPPPEAGGSILLVDDEPAILSGTGTLLRNAGYQVTSCDRAERALELCRERRFDLVILDIVMPGMGGLAAYRRLRAEQPELPVVLSSGFSEPDPILDEPGEVEFLRKPYRKSDLLSAMGRALRGH